MKFILHRPEIGTNKDIEVGVSLDDKSKDALFFCDTKIVADLKKASIEAISADVMEIHGFEPVGNGGNYKHRIWFLRPIWLNESQA